MRVFFLLLAGLAVVPAAFGQGTVSARELGSVLIVSPAEVASPPPAALADSMVARRITAGERLLLVAGSVGGGFASVWLVGPFAPVGSVAGLYGMGHALGLDASLRSVLGDAAWGAGAGALAGYGMYGYVTLIQGYDADLSAGLGSAAFGLLVGSVTAAMLYDAAPTVLLTPTVEVVPGLALLVAL